MGKNPEIIVIGAAIIDVLACRVGPEVFHNGSYPADSICMTTGGDALNEAILLSKMGKKVYLETVIGEDEAGMLVVHRCEKNGISLEKRQIRPGMFTSVNVVLVQKNGERSFLTDPQGAQRKLRVDNIRMPFPETAKILCFASIFVFPEIGPDDLKIIFSQAKSQGMTVCADMTKPKKGESVADFAEVLPYIYYLIPNEEEACMFTKQETAEKAALKLLCAGVRHVVIKCGDRGCLVMDETGVCQVPAVESVDCVDTTGAGDSFVAGFLYALSEGKNLRECAEYGNACGAKAVTVTGATEWLASNGQPDLWL